MLTCPRKDYSVYLYVCIFGLHQMKLINPLVILRILSTILVIETISFLLCLPVAIIFKEDHLPFLWPAVVSISLSVILYFVSRNADTEKFSNRDGYLSVTLSWLIFTLLGTLPYLIGGTIPSFINAFFESTSGFSTTGASVLADVEHLPHSIMFWRSFTQWIGGLGIILLVLLVLPSFRVAGYQLFSLESSLKEKVLPKANALGFRLLIIYLGLTLIEAVLLSLGDMNIFDSICHAFGTISTGGFSTRNTSLMGYSSYTQYIVLIFMFLAGTSNVVYYYLLKFNFVKVRHNEELWFYLAISAVAGAVATSFLLVSTTKSLEPAFREGFFQVLSVLTTTGYTTADYNYWPMAGTLLLFILMFAGASTGSASGGIKMARHLVVIKNVRNVFTRLSHPNRVTVIKLNGKTTSENSNISIISFIVLYLFIFIIGTIVVAATGLDVVSASSATATCMAGAGPGLGSVGPLNTFSGIPAVSKVVLSILMIVGRLEIIPVFVLFSKSFWKL
jgi:trk system potassium uptake protein